MIIIIVVAIDIIVVSNLQKYYFLLSFSSLREQLLLSIWIYFKGFFY